MMDHAARAAAEFVALSGVESHDLAVILGSGWNDAARHLGDVVYECPSTDLPYFPAPSVPGHSGIVRSSSLADMRILTFLGRTHLYEGKGIEATSLSVRTAAALGCTTIVLTNGAGGLNPTWAPGTTVVISDHINLTGDSPLFGPTFIDLSDVYSTRLRTICREIDPNLPEGVYVQMRGPMFETPAEIRMLQQVGGDLVGMSTALEAIVARSLGMEVLGISLVTNPAAGITSTPINHEEVLATGTASADRIGELLAAVIRRL